MVVYHHHISSLKVKTSSSGEYSKIIADLVGLCYDDSVDPEDVDRIPSFNYQYGPNHFVTVGEGLEIPENK